MPLGPPLRSAPAALARAARRLSLQARLLLGLVVVASLGLVAADVVVYAQIHSYVVDQVDGELRTALNPLLRELGGGGSFGGAVDFRQDTPPGSWGFVVSSSGTATQAPSVALGPLPALPSLGALNAAVARSGLAFHTSLGPVPYALLSVGASGADSFEYRVVAVPIGQNSIAVVAIPLSGANAILHRLLLIDLAVSAAAIVLLVALGYGAVRVGMRPLVDIERTAEAIAEGDLTRRVENDDTRTEVGRLGASLNAMLAQIEHAFAEQQASENRLRQFLADASHELRTPVTSIRGYSELFRRGAQSRPEDLALAMRRVEEESIRMGVLVDDLLLLARLDQGRPLERAPVDLAAIATDAAADAQVLAPHRPITLEAPEPVVLIGDAGRLRQVVTNLVRNALVHTPEGTPVTVTVRAEGGRAVLSVRDEGPGIPQEHAQRIFERFYRADPSRARAHGGSGLGLAIVASIAEAHQGSARVETAPGEGATFVVELPLEPEELEPPARWEGSDRDRAALGDEPGESAPVAGDEAVPAGEDAPGAR